jgi:ABC-type glycerol-3-phosphate transport system substrate-binding protein
MAGEIENPGLFQCVLRVIIIPCRVRVRIIINFNFKEKMMRRIKKIFVCLTLLVFSSALVFAGGRRQSASGKADLLVSVWAGLHADLQKTVSRDYTPANIIVDDVDYGNLKQKQLTSFQAAAGTGNYEVVWVNSQWMKEYVSAGYIIPIDDYIKTAGIDLNMYARGLVDGCVFDGKIYGLPTYAQTLILAYDGEAFSGAGVKVPSNAEELIAAAKYFKEQGSGIAIPARQGTAAVTLFSQLLFSDGGGYFDGNGKLAINSPAAIYAADVYDRLVHYGLEGVTAWHHDETAEAVRMKNAPIGIIMSGLANQNADPERSLIVNSVRYAPVTGGSGKAAATNSFWVWAVADYCIWMSSPATEKRQTLADQQISAVNALGGDPEVLARAPFLPVVMEQLANGKIDPPLISFNALKADLVVALSEIATTNASAADVLGRLRRKYENTDFSE